MLCLVPTHANTNTHTYTQVLYQIKSGFPFAKQSQYMIFYVALDNIKAYLGLYSGIFALKKGFIPWGGKKDNKYLCRESFFWA